MNRRALGQKFARFTTDAVLRSPRLWRLFRPLMRKQFDAIAGTWDEMRAPDHLASYERALEAVDPPPGRALDLGTGTGQGAFAIGRPLLSAPERRPRHIRHPGPSNTQVLPLHRVWPRANSHKKLPIRLWGLRTWRPFRAGLPVELHPWPGQTFAAPATTGPSEPGREPPNAPSSLPLRTCLLPEPPPDSASPPRAKSCRV